MNRAFYSIKITGAGVLLNQRTVRGRPGLVVLAQAVSVCKHIDRVDRTRRTDEDPIAFTAAESQVTHDFRNTNLANQRTIRIIAMYPVGGT